MPLAYIIYMFTFAGGSAYETEIDERGQLQAYSSSLFGVHGLDLRTSELVMHFAGPDPRLCLSVLPLLWVPAALRTSLLLNI